jgi:parallel beta-helix repeat protein
VNSESAGYGSTNIVFDSCVIVGDGVSRSVGMNITGSLANPTRNVVVVNCSISGFGDVNATFDQDANAMILGPVISDVWVLYSRLEECSGSGIRMGGSPGEEPEWARRIYFAGNTVRRVRQSGIAVKYGADIVISQNTVSDIIDTDWSHSKGIGLQYGPRNVWVLYNRVSGGRYGVRVASTDSGGDFPVYIIGNVISDAHLLNEVYPGGSWDEAGIHVQGGSERYIVNNTIYNCDAGINLSGSRIYTVENNIIVNVTQTLGNHLFIEDAINTTEVRNNIFHQSGNGAIKLRVGSTTRNLDGFQTATGKGQGCLAADPRFTNPSGGNFQLLADSPAIDAGLAPQNLTVDVYARFLSMFGVPIDYDALSVRRPVSAWDIGPYEFWSGAPRPNKPVGLRVVP